jgi:glutamate/tyrosine decarboxylase-like PLP-dependent enzyme
MTEPCTRRSVARLTLETNRRRAASWIEHDGVSEKKIQQAKYLAWLVEREEELELSTPVGSRNLCFRYKPHRLFDFTENEVDNLNREILNNLHTSGRAALSSADKNGCFVLNAAVTNHRPLAAELESLIGAVLYWGRRILGRRAGATLG